MKYRIIRSENGWPFNYVVQSMGRDRWLRESYAAWVWWGKLIIKNLERKRQRETVVYEVEY